MINLTGSHPENLILISLDTMRADVAYSGRLEHFSKLLARGTAFRNTVCSAPLTPVSHASVFTGLQPYGHGIRHLFKEPLNTSQPTLAQLFAARNYRTAAIVSCPGMNRWYGMNAGFDHYDDEVPKLADGSSALETVDVELRGTAMKRAPAVVERSLQWLDKHRSNPFFLFIHFFDTHWPYEPPEWYAPEGANAYEGEAHFVDHHLGQFIDQIEQWGLVDNTAIVIFSDHGEDLAGWYPDDHAGDLGHPEEKGHGCCLYECTQMVPLVYISPDQFPADTWIDTQVRLVDVLPTICDMLKIPDTATRHGSSLVELLHSPGPHRTAYFETFYREEQNMYGKGIPGLGPWTGLRIDNRHKVVFDINSATTTVFDLKTDPHERQPLDLGPALI